MATTLTWLGHAAFRIDTHAGTRIYVDPFLEQPAHTRDDGDDRIYPRRGSALGHGYSVGCSGSASGAFACCCGSLPRSFSK